MRRTHRALLVSVLIHGAALGALAGFLPLPPALSPPLGPVEVSWTATTTRARTVPRQFSRPSLAARNGAATIRSPKAPPVPVSTAAEDPPSSPVLRAYLSEVFAEVERRMAEPAQTGLRNSASLKLGMVVLPSGEVRDIKVLSGDDPALGLLAAKVLVQERLPRFPSQLSHLAELKLVLPIEFSPRRRP